MFERANDERKSGNSEQLNSVSWVRRSAVPAALLLIMFCVLRGSSRGQGAENSIDAYAAAVKQSVISERIVAMEHYLTLAGASRLKVDALEFLVWDHMRLGHQAQAQQRARELLAAEPVNALAIAVLNQESPSGQGKNAMQKRLAMLESTLTGLSQLRQPEGMPVHNFHSLRRQVAIMLNGAIGMTYLAIPDYPTARPFLQQAVDDDPNNAQWVYSLGLALLNGKNKDEYRGYWYLARAANLTEQTPQGREIADYARRTYHSGGGTDSGWQAFVLSAAALDAPPNPAGSSVSTATNTKATTASAAASRSSQGSPQAEQAAPTSGPEKANEERVASVTSGKDRNSKGSSGFEATLREPDRPELAPERRSPDRPKAIAAPSQAVSLGILIETSLLTHQNRATIIATLKEIVRNLRANDEACILVFSDQLDFEQDLTADDHLLEDALSQIHPKNAKALLSGIAFAAGHLKRIGKNPNRILLVISDGDAKPAAADTLAFRSQVSGVRVHCVGLKTAGENGRALLERMAAYSGGTASFASGPEEFRTVALQITRSMGIAVP